MTRRAPRRIGRLLLVGAVLWGLGQVLTRRLDKGDAAANELSFAAVFGGKERTSAATALRRVRCLAFCGGAQLDLRDATLDPAGADLDVKAVMGGVQVLVPEEWRVTVEEDTTAGGVDTQVTAPAELPADAPTLVVRAVARMGGVQVTTKDGGVPTDGGFASVS
jgi:Cell wall-active antibiotics response LiaF, C-terminal